MQMVRAAQDPSTLPRHIGRGSAHTTILASRTS